MLNFKTLGLTLVETMIALTILLAVVGLIASPVGKYYQMTKRNQATSTSVNAAQAAMESIKARLTDTPESYAAADFTGIDLTGLTLTCAPLDSSLTPIAGQTCTNYSSPLKRITLSKTDSGQNAVVYQLDLAAPIVSKAATP